MITRGQAAEIARVHLTSRRPADQSLLGEATEPADAPAIREVRALKEISRAPVLYYRVPVNLEDCWIVYLASRRLGLQSSQIILVSKEQGEVLYYGSAHDEG